MKGKLEDSFLLAGSLSGDEKAFAKLYDKYIERIYRFVVWRVASREDAQDITAEVFLKAWEYLNQEKKRVENFQAFIYRIASNSVIDYYRCRDRNETLNISDEQWDSLVDKSFSLEDSINKKEEWKRAYKLIQKLSLADRELILMKYAEDLSIKEIAKIFDKSTGAVRVALHRAMKSLKELL